MKIPSRFLVVPIPLFVAVGLSAPVLAEGGGDGSIRVLGQVSPFITGSAGTGIDAPDYSYAFSNG